MKRLRNQHDIDVAKLPEEVFAKAMEEADIEESSHPDGVMHTTAMQHPEWFEGKVEKILKGGLDSIPSP